MRTILGQLNAQTLPLTANTPTLLQGNAATRPTTPRLSLVVKNTSAGTVYIGGPTVSATQGYPLAAGEAFPADATDGAAYAFSTSAVSVAILEGF